MADLDPRWDWIDITPISEPPGTRFIKGACRHLPRFVDRVENVDGDLVGHLCTTCDAALPPEWQRAAENDGQEA